MKQDEIIEMARQADPFGKHGRLYVMAQLTPETIEAFAKLVAAKERERMIYAGPHEWAKEAIELENEACAERAWIALVKHGQPLNVRKDVTDAIRAKGEA